MEGNTEFLVGEEIINKSIHEMKATLATHRRGIKESHETTIDEKKTTLETGKCRKDTAKMTGNDKVNKPEKIINAKEK
jgi:hypothetical protein